MKRTTLTFLFALAMALPLQARDVRIQGQYLEARTADVYTGPCFANGEVNLTGKEAIMAWHVHQGGWQGVPLDGLTVVAVVRAHATLGDPFSSPLPARAILLLDQRATHRQQVALQNFARTVNPGLLGNVESVKVVPIHFQVENFKGTAVMKAGHLAELKTRPLTRADDICGNEEVYYPPLAPVNAPTPAYTLVHSFQGKGLNDTWRSPHKRSAFIATFAY